MQEANQNNMEGWKQQLDALSTVNGIEAVDKAVAWEKLQQKRTTKKKSVFGGWYYWAAACLVLGFISVAITNSYRQEQVVVQANPVLQTDKKMPVIINTEALMIPNSSGETASPVSSKAVVQPTVTKPKNITATVFTETNKTEKLIDSSLQEFAIAPQLPDTVSDFIAETAATKKVMQLVHINDLDGPLNFKNQVDINKKKSYTKNVFSFLQPNVQVKSGNSLFTIQLKPFKSN